ncbi:hypothetical protein [Legionella tunisiensis]|uniref:hypothetical protein n=1 Tax=Legionella tunisiensis TaxID=1034944 RepID=UPI000317CA2B|nr:hypothetical protein [Legionella tunisiensis]
MTNRDDFLAKIKRTLAQRVAYCCSNPNCLRITLGPGTNKNKIINIGQAAHITAASPGGARYNEFISPEERKSISNGIWLCCNCAHIVDTDIQGHSVELLNSWKFKAEKKPI